MSKLALLIAKEEGYGIPGAIPTLDNNPGDLRHSPHSFHTPSDPNAIGKIDTVANGWADLERQLREFAGEEGDHPGVSWTLEQAIYAFAPPSENNSAAYLSYVCSGLGCPPQTLVSDALKIT